MNGGWEQITPEMVDELLALCLKEHARLLAANVCKDFCDWWRNDQVCADCEAFIKSREAEDEEAYLEP